MDQHSLYAELSDMVYGHHEVKKMLINLIKRMHIRAEQRKNMVSKNKLVPLKNILLIGASGTGKTYLVECLKKMVDFALFRFDATKLAPTSAKGITIENMISEITKGVIKLSRASNVSEEEVWSHVVVFIDEVDKLAKPYDSSGNWNTQIQANLLTLIENKSKIPYDVSFIFAGAFSGMEVEDKSVSNLGFCSTPGANKKQLPIDEALIKYGLIPEFVGRMNNIASLDELKEKDYLDILHLKLLPETNNTLNYIGANLMGFNDEESKELVAKAMKSGQGIRYLKRILNQMSEDLEFNAPVQKFLPPQDN